MLKYCNSPFTRHLFPVYQVHASKITRMIQIIIAIHLATYIDFHCLLVLSPTETTHKST